MQEINNETITITKKEYDNLLENMFNVKAFARFVNNEKYSIDRKNCGALLNFEVKDGSVEENANDREPNGEGNSVIGFAK